MKRRSFLKGSVATGAAVLAANAGLLAPNTVLAAYNKAAFDAATIEDGIKALMGSASTGVEANAKLKAPAIAENGLVVPVTVEAEDMAGVEAIGLFVSTNPKSLACAYHFSNGAKGYMSTRIKMGKTSKVVAAIKAGGKVTHLEQEVKVTIGGCGG
jgi:sulfur-oxidizing protein SoxY